jgi:hypothetical protein
MDMRPKASLWIMESEDVRRVERDYVSACVFTEVDDNQYILDIHLDIDLNHYMATSWIRSDEP